MIDTVPKDGTVTTDTEHDGATANDPVETWVEPPVGCTVQIVEAPLPAAAEAFQFFGQSVDIDASCDPNLDSGTPIKIEFELHLPEFLSERQKGENLTVFRNGRPVLPCTGDEGVAIPSPCFPGVPENPIVEGDVAHFTVLTRRASAWHLGEAFDPAFLCHQTKQAKDSEKFQTITTAIGSGVEARPVLMSRVGSLCSPATVDGHDVSDPATHLQSFGVKLAKVCANDLKKACRKNNECDDGIKCIAQTKLAESGSHAVHGVFGSLVVEVDAPKELRVPSAAAENSMPAQLASSSSAVPALACAKVTVQKGVCVGDPNLKCKADADCGDEDGPCFLGVSKTSATVDDQVLTEPLAVALGNPRVLCRAVALGGELPANPASSLLCYGATRTKQCSNASSTNHAAACTGEKKCGGTQGATKLCQKLATTGKSLGVASKTGAFSVTLERDTKKEVELCIPVTVD